MSFDTLESPISLPFIWYAKYNDDTIISEYTDTGVKNDFYSLDKTKIKEFGLFGRGNKLYINTSDGIFHMVNQNISLLNKQVELYFIDNTNIQTNITNNSVLDYSDVFALKGFFGDLAKGQTTAVWYINEFLFGYNTKISLPKGNLSLKVSFNMPLGKKITMKIKLVPDGFNLIGNLFVVEDKDNISNPYRFSLSGSNPIEIIHELSI